MDAKKIRFYHIWVVNIKTGYQQQLTGYPMPHSQCCTMKSKMIQHSDTQHEIRDFCTVEQINEELFNDMIEALPPIDWTYKGFLLGEPYNHRPCLVTGKSAAEYSAFAQYAGDFYRIDYLTRAEWQGLSDVNIHEMVMDYKANQQA